MCIPPRGSRRRRFGPCPLSESAHRTLEGRCAAAARLAAWGGHGLRGCGQCLEERCAGAARLEAGQYTAETGSAECTTCLADDAGAVERERCCDGGPAERKVCLDSQKLTWPILVNSMDNCFNRFFAAWPVRAFIVDTEGRLTTFCSQNVVHFAVTHKIR